ncbi:secreted RxLR effector protein 161-like [Nicotiana tomentosiformis]|uniref:secreted RxLR effector protein 161-like n=1 Tax=Nicotiana tomentosiformis TaxID=4098 RepID=UPI00388C6447
MQEELDQFDKNQVWKLLPKPENALIIGTKWVFRNKLNEDGKVVRNKAILVAQGYSQQEGVDYDETFAPTKYTKELIQKFVMSNAKSIGTPMSPSTSLNKDEQVNPVDGTKYRGMIGSLLYLTASRLDIMFSVCKCAKFQSAPKESHLTAVKRIIRYLIGTISHGLWYPRFNNFKLEDFSDVDLTGDKEDRKSTSGTCQLLGKALISWNSKKQGSFALSTT